MLLFLRITIAYRGSQLSSDRHHLNSQMQYKCQENPRKFSGFVWLGKTLTQKFGFLFIHDLYTMLQLEPG